jgi:hypothetical protein
MKTFVQAFVSDWTGKSIAGKKQSVPSPLCPRSRVLREKDRMRGQKNQTVALFDPLSPALLCPRSRVLPEGEGVYGTAVVKDR